MQTPDQRPVFFKQLNETTFESTQKTAGPWSPELQHASPPTALLSRCIEHFQPRADLRLARVSFEILRPIPVAELEVQVSMVKAGRRSELLEGTLLHDGQPLVLARAQRLAASPENTPVHTANTPEAPPIPESSAFTAWPGAHLDGYLSAIEWREAEGSFSQMGSATAWAKAKVDLLADEETSPWCKAMLIVDSVSGIGMTVNPAEFQIINTDVSMYLHRDPVGDWICLSGGITSSPHGSGIAEGNIWDEQGPIGRVLQTMFIANY